MNLFCGICRGRNRKALFEERKKIIETEWSFCAGPQVLLAIYIYIVVKESEYDVIKKESN